MNLLCIDIGNTSTSFCLITNHILNRIHRIINNNDLEKYLYQYNFKNIDDVIISSVAPNKYRFIKKILNKRRIKTFNINYKNCGFDLLVHAPKEVGVDRICNIAAIKLKNKFPAIIIDFGTATTYDVINNEGNFIGGAIAPGIDVSANHLINKTELLRETIYQFPDSVIGKDTSTNIQSGVMIGGLKSVEGMIELISKELENNNINIILTGGFGKLITRRLNIKHIYNEKLTFIGMEYIYDYNH